MERGKTFPRGVVVETAEKPEKKKTGLARFIVIVEWIAISLASVVAFAFMVATVGIVVATYWMDRADVARLVEKAATRMLGVDLSIGSMEFGAGLIGFSDVTVTLKDGSRFSVKNMSALIESLPIFDDKIVVSDLVIDNPSVSLIMPASSQMEKEKEPTEKSFRFSDIAIPIPLQIRNVKVRNIAFEMRRDDLWTRLHGVGVTGRGAVGKEGLNLSATVVTSSDSGFVMKQNNLELDVVPAINFGVAILQSGRVSLSGAADVFAQKIVSPYKIPPSRVTMEFNGSGEISAKPAARAEAAVSINGGKKANVTAVVDDEDAGVRYDVNVKNLNIDLGVMNEAFGPKEMTLHGAGFLNWITTQGFIGHGDTGKTENEISGECKLQITRFSGWGTAAPEGGSAKISLDKFRLTDTGYSGDLSARVNAGFVKAKDIALYNPSLSIDTVMTGDKTDDEISTTGDLIATLSIPKAGNGNITFDSVKVSLGASGDFAAGNFDSVVGDFSLGDAAQINLAGVVRGYGKEKIALKADMNAALASVAKLIPDGPESLEVEVDGGDMDAAISLNGKAGAGWDRPDMTFDADITVANLAGTVKKYNAKIAETQINAKSSGKIAQKFTVKNLDSEMEIHSKGAAVAKAFATGPFEAQFIAASPDPMKDRIDAQLGFKAEKITPVKEFGKPFPAEALIGGAVDVEKNRGEIKFASIKMGDMADLSARGWYEGVDRKFSAVANVEKLNLKPVYFLVPEDIRESARLEKLGGSLRGAFTGSGVIPASLDEISYPLPFEFGGDMNVAGGEIVVTQPEMVASGIDLRLDAEVKKDVASASGTVSISSFADDRFIGSREISPNLEFDMKLTGNNRFDVARFALTVPEFGLAEYLEGSLSGENIVSLLDTKTPLGTKLTKIKAEFDNSLAIYFDKPRGVGKDYVIAGDLSLETKLKSDPASTLSLDGKGAFRDFSLRRGDVTLVDQLNGAIPFVKTLSFAKEGQTAESSPKTAGATSVRETSFFDDLRKAGGAPESFTAKLIQAGPVALADALFDLYFKNTRFGIDYFKTGILGGGLTGSLHARTENGAYVLRTSEVFAGIDLEKLLEKKLELTGEDARIDGSVNLEIELKGEGDGVDTLDINKIDAYVSVTKIGAKALDKLLLFLDPDESSPSIMNARAILKYATPTRVDLSTKNGALSLTLDVKYTPLLGGRTVSMPVIRKVPMQSLVNFESIRDYTKKFSGVAAMLRQIQSERIVIADDGNITLR